MLGLASGGKPRRLAVIVVTCVASTRRSTRHSRRAEPKAQSTSIQNGQDPLDTSDQPTETGEQQKSSRKPWNWKPLTRSNQRKALLLQDLLPNADLLAKQNTGIAAPVESVKGGDQFKFSSMGSPFGMYNAWRNTSGRNSLQSYDRNITKVSPSQNHRAWKPLQVHVNIVTYPNTSKPPRMNH